MNFEATIEVLEINENTGRERYFNYFYMIKAKSFCEAERLAQAYMNERGKIGSVNSLTISNIVTVDKATRELYFKVKAVFEAEDETTGKQKRYHQFHLIAGDDITKALRRSKTVLGKYYKGTEFEIHQEIKTPFINIINY